MKSIAKLKDKARKHEQKEDWQAAIQVYQQVLDTQEEEEDLELELSLFNRIGDLNLRLGQTDEAVTYYETAADKYAESGFFNNAIALCNKALRHRPDRPAIYLKLSRLCNEQGFQTDARRWILEYAERQVAAGQEEAALTGLEEFAQLSDDPEVRELLAQQLATHDRPDEAVEQLRTAYHARVAAGHTDKAASIAEKARSIDPSADFASETPPPPAEPVAEPAEADAGGDEAQESTDAEAAGAGADELGIEPTAIETPQVAGDEPEPVAGVDELETRTETVEDAEPAGTLEGLEATHAGTDADDDAADQVSGLEVGFSERDAPAAPEDADSDALGGLETFSPAGGTDEAVDEAAEGAFDAEEVEEPLDAEEAEEAEEIEEAEEPFDTEPVEEPFDADEVGEPDEEPMAVEGGMDFEDEEDAEPLPLLDSDSDEESEEEAEPLPMLDTGFEDQPDDIDGTDDSEAVDSAQEAEDTEDTEEDALDLTAGLEAEEPDEEAPDEGGAMDLSFDDGEATATAEDAAADAASEGASSAPAGDDMDLDLGSFDLGFETAGGEEAEAVPVEDLDVESIIQRSRELVSRGLMDEALRELRVLSGTDAGADVFDNAIGVVNEIVRNDENDISALQRRVEYAARIGDRARLVEAYLDLADALTRVGAETKARAMYQRALDLDPDNEAARAALGEAEEEDEEAIDLDAVLREMEPEEMEAAGAGGSSGSGSDPNFAAMLNQFKAKVNENVDADDAGDHYDLGLAFKEMGLIDEAIAEFQTALTGGEERLKVYEELGQCFVQKSQYNVALKIFDRALKVPYTDAEELLGVYYHMGQCYEELGKRQEAREAYEKVLSIDEEFADVPDRMARL